MPGPFFFGSRSRRAARTRPPRSVACVGVHERFRALEVPMRRSMLILALLLLSACSDGRRFSPEAWAQEDRFQRQAFTSDLIARRLLIGKGWSEVQNMLGPGRTRGTEVS